MTVEEMLNGLDFLAYEADKNQQPNKEKLLYAAANALRAGKAMADHLDRCINHHNPPLIRYEEALILLIMWDKATSEDV